MPEEVVSERWSEVPDWEGIYSVSTWGRVKGLPRVTTFSDGRVRRYPERIMKLYIHDRDGYLGVKLVSGNRNESWLVHRLIMATFVGPCPPGMEVRHLNGVPSDNALFNLRYGTHSENVGDQKRHGTLSCGGARKFRCKRGHLLESPNLREIRLRDKVRECESCYRARSLLRNGNCAEYDIQCLSDHLYREIAGLCGENVTQETNA